MKLLLCSLSETYLTVKGAALMLSSSNCLRTAGNDECEQSQGSRKYCSCCVTVVFSLMFHWSLSDIKIYHYVLMLVDED